MIYHTNPFQYGWPYHSYGYPVSQVNPYGYYPNQVKQPYLMPTGYNYTPGINLPYGPYVEGPSTQMIPPDWFKYYVR